MQRIFDHHGLKPNSEEVFRQQVLAAVKNGDFADAERIVKLQQLTIDRVCSKILGGSTIISVKPEHAREIMGEDSYFGAEAVLQTWGIKLTPEQIPIIPFSRDELIRASALGQMLILRVSRAPDGEPLTLEKMEQLSIVKFTRHTHGYPSNTDAPELEWALVTKGIVPGSGYGALGNDNHAYQNKLHVLADYVRKVFDGTEMPPEYKAALDEFSAKEMTNFFEVTYNRWWDWNDYVMPELQLAKLLTRSPVEVVHDAAVVATVSGQYKGIREKTRSLRLINCFKP